MKNLYQQPLFLLLALSALAAAANAFSLEAQPLDNGCATALIY